MKPITWIAASFAMLTVAATAWGGPDIAAGKAKSKTCAPCHGANAEGKGKFPALAGMDEKHFVEDIKEYKSGQRKNGMMKSTASKLSEQDVENLAAYFASLKAK